MNSLERILQGHLCRGQSVHLTPTAQVRERHVPFICLYISMLLSIFGSQSFKVDETQFESA